MTRPNREVNILIQDRGERLERCPREQSLTLQQPEHLMHSNKRTDCVHRCSWREGCLSKSSLSFLTCEIYLPKSTQNTYILWYTCVTITWGKKKDIINTLKKSSQGSCPMGIFSFCPRCIHHSAFADAIFKITVPSKCTLEPSWLLFDLI